jgi:hypothetical protein
MQVLLVTYDLNSEPTSEGYKAILNVIKSEKNWAKLSESSYAMHTAMSPQLVYERVKPHLDANDNFLVLTLSKPYFGRHSKAVIEWLSSKLT